MGEPVDSVLAGSVERASDILKGNINFLKEDIKALTKFQDEVEKIDLGSDGSSGRVLLSDSRQDSDTEEVMNLFDDLFYSRQESSDIVEDNADKYDLDEPAAHFLQELFNIANISRSEAVSKIRYLDSENPMGGPHVQETVSLAEYLKANRKQVVEGIEKAEDSLSNYQEDLSALEDHVLHLNEEYTLPMDVDDAETVVRYLDIVEERLDQLENRREHELRRMPDLISEYTVKTVNTYFEDEEFDDPVLYEIDEIRENIYEARENIKLN